MGFGGEHREQACRIHGVIHRTRQLSVRLGTCGIVFDKRSETFDFLQKVHGHVTRRHVFLLLCIVERPNAQAHLLPEAGATQERTL